MGEALDFKTLEKMGQVVVEKVALEMRMFSMLMQNGRGWGEGGGSGEVAWHVLDTVVHAPLSGTLGEWTIVGG